MPSTTVPTPVAACLGLVPAVLSSVRGLPGKALSLPVLAVTGSFALLGAARQEYDDLAARGERLYANLRRRSLDERRAGLHRLDELEDQFEALVDRTPFASAYDAAEDAVEAVFDDVEELAHNAAGLFSGNDSNGNGNVDRPADQPDDVVDLRDDEQPKGVATPKAPQNARSPREAAPARTAAPADVVKVVEAVTAEIATEPVSSDELPLANYDHLTLGALRGHLRSLDVAQLVQVRDYEIAHANRLPVVTMLDNRIAKRATTGADPVVVSGRPAQTPTS